MSGFVIVENEKEPKETKETKEKEILEKLWKEYKEYVSGTINDTTHFTGTTRDRWIACAKKKACEIFISQCLTNKISIPKEISQTLNEIETNNDWLS
jgi:uncharacterized phage-associated protein